MELPTSVLYSGAVTWKAWLQGHPFDFDDLTRLFGSGDTVVAKDDEGYYLMSTAIVHDIDRDSLFEAMKRLLMFVNGTAKAVNPAFRPVELNGSFSNGERRHVIASFRIGLGRIQASPVGVVPDPNGEGCNNPTPRPPGPSRVAAAIRHADAAEALQIMGKDEPTNWVDLYKVYEIVRAATGGESGLVNSGFATKPDISAFTASANLPSVSGEHARHARMSGTPKRSMQITEAREFIGRLLTSWIDALD
jgi:hypothetical protein